jgi:cytochrome b subunit of formate dehydrogenase
MLILSSPNKKNRIQKFKNKSANLASNVQSRHARTPTNGALEIRSEQFGVQSGRHQCYTQTYLYNVIVCNAGTVRVACTILCCSVQYPFKVFSFGVVLLCMMLSSGTMLMMVMMVMIVITIMVMITVMMRVMVIIVMLVMLTGSSGDQARQEHEQQCNTTVTPL